MQRFFILLVGIFLITLQNSCADQKPLPIYSSKPTKMGLYPEELISPKELFSLMKENKKVVILDARGKKSFEGLHILGAVLPLSSDYYTQAELFRAGIVKKEPNTAQDLAQTMKKYSSDIPIVTYCNDDCQASAVLLLQLKHLGFNNVRALDTGVQSWQKAGFPVAQESA